MFLNETVLSVGFVTQFRDASYVISCGTGDWRGFLLEEVHFVIYHSVECQYNPLQIYFARRFYLLLCSIF